MWPFDDVLTAVNYVWELLYNLPGQIIDVLVQITMVCLYPVVVLVGVLQAWFGALYQAFAAFFNVLLLIPNTAIEIYNASLLTVFPAAWTVALIAVLFVVLGLRAYSFIKDISIAGCKI